MSAEDFRAIEAAVELAIEHIISKGCDDIFKPPVFLDSLEHEIIKNNEENFRSKAYAETVRFIKAANLEHERIGPIRNTLIVKDNNSFRQVAWMDPFDAVKYLAVCILLFEKIEQSRIPKDFGFIHSHRTSENAGELFDQQYGYDSFRKKSGELSRERKGEWKVVTDIANFFDRIGNHSLENHLLDIGCNKQNVTLLREMLYFWSGDRRSYGVPVGSDASRIISEAVLVDIDRKLKESDIVFVRYVDDYRLFAKTRAGAYKALQILTTLLADEGLTINGKKTFIYEILDDEETIENEEKTKHAEHEPIDENKKSDVIIKRVASGRSNYSKYYKEPGKEALEKIKLLDKKTIFESLHSAHSSQKEDQIKLIVKYFIYANQDPKILEELIYERATTIFYIVDALTKESGKFTKEKRQEITEMILSAMNWKDCAYPYQIPVLKLLSTKEYRDTSLSRHIIDHHKYSDSNIFFREVISLSFPTLDRARMRELSLIVYPTMPPFVQRSIYNATKNHPNLSNDEKRPLLKNMKQGSDDWFINTF